jgi:hypothetical protein
VTHSSEADLALLESELQSLAAEAVGKLAITAEIKRLGPTLFQQIEDCDAFAGTVDDALFIATSLPIANALIHYAASQFALRDARNWARDRWPDAPDPTSMLAALTLIYIVNEGQASSGAEPERKTRWERIHQRIEKILQTAPREAAMA